jgi:hypothetical protein
MISFKLETGSIMSISRCTFKDLPALDALYPAMRARMMARLRWHICTPYAVAIKHAGPSGTVNGLGMAIVHQGTGWLGNCIALPGTGRSIAEAELQEALLAELRDHGCSTVSTVVEEDRVSAWTRMGFVTESRYLCYAGGSCEDPTLDEVELYEPQHILGVLHLDRKASGEDRRPLVGEHLYVGRIYTEKGRVRGFYLPLLGDGLIIADRPDVGKELLRWHLPHVREIWLPEANAAARAFLEQRGYSLQGCRLRMRLGDALAWQPEVVYGWIGEGLG